MKTIEEKIDMYLTDATIYHSPKGRIDLSKLDLKAIGYKMTKQKCCGTCDYYLEMTCRNEQNMSIIAKEYDIPIPIHAGLDVDPQGICPNYEEY
jgi:hypothetical protein